MEVIAMYPITRRRVRSLWTDPFDAIRQLDKLIARPCDEFDGQTELVGSYPVDIREDGDAVYVDAEVPGFGRDEIEVTLDQGVLHISAERQIEATDGEQHLQERRYTKVARSFTLPSTVQDGKVDAKLADGVLHLTLPKREEARPRKIEVN